MSVQPDFFEKEIAKLLSILETTCARLDADDDDKGTAKEVAAACERETESDPKESTKD
jgi:hypothetical protein